jgi:hypothetical protein
LQVKNEKNILSPVMFSLSDALAVLAGTIGFLAKKELCIVFSEVKKHFLGH